MRDPKTNVSTGTAFCEYLNLDVASKLAVIPVYINEQQVMIKRCGGESSQASTN
jgi:hypothetical protein